MKWLCGHSIVLRLEVARDKVLLYDSKPLYRTHHKVLKVICRKYKRFGMEFRTKYKSNELEIANIYEDVVITIEFTCYNINFQ